MPTDKFASTAPALAGVAVRSVALNVSGGDQTLAEIPSGFWCQTSGNIVGRLRDDAEDGTFPVVAGAIYGGRFAVIRQSGTSAAGRFLYTA